MVLEKNHILTCSFFLNCVSVSSSYMNDVYYNFVYRVLLYVRHLTLHTYILYNMTGRYNIVYLQYDSEI